MKKFGTPSGAGPGSANEKVGLAGVGTPAELVGAGLVVLDSVEDTGTVTFPAPPVECLDLECDLRLGLELLLLELDCEEAAVDVDEVEVVVVTVAEGPVLLGAHEALTFFTGPVPGGTSAEVGVPGGTLTLKVRVCPLRSVTVTTH